MNKTPEPQPLFIKGKSYPLRTQTVIVKRTVEKPDPFTGRKVLLEFTGQELAIFLTGEDENEYCFMDAKILADPTCEINVAKRTVSRGNEKFEPGDAQKVDFDLLQLVNSFEIPEVPDVAAVNPEQYDVNLDKLTELETTFNQLCAA